MSLYILLSNSTDMCPTPQPEDTIGNTNTIEELPDPIPELFSVLTEEEDAQKRWTIYSYPVYYESLYTRFTNREKNKENGTLLIDALTSKLYNLMLKK